MDLSFWSVTGWLSLVVWVVLFAFRGGFWRLRERLRERLGAAGATNPSLIAAVIPARDEAETIGQTVASLVKQRNVGLHVSVVDDESADDTGELARLAGAHHVIEAGDRPAGWKGKLWALHRGVAEIPPEAEYILFTDADIAYEDPDAVHRLLVKASEGFDLVSVMVHLRCESTAEKLLIPAFVYFFFKLYPPAWVMRRPSVAAAAGGCMLIRRTVFEKLGGVASYRNALIDDCALARRVKAVGGRVWLGLSDGAIRSSRGYESATVIRRMIARSAFDQLNHSPLLLVGTLLGMAIIYLVPLSFLWTGQPEVLLAWLLSAAMFLPSVRTFGAPLWTALCLPFIAIFYVVATIESALNYWRGKGGEWKGRVQDAR